MCEYAGGQAREAIRGAAAHLLCIAAVYAGGAHGGCVQLAPPHRLRGLSRFCSCIRFLVKRLFPLFGFTRVLFNDVRLPPAVPFCTRMAPSARMDHSWRKIFSADVVNQTAGIASSRICTEKLASLLIYYTF